MTFFPYFSRRFCDPPHLVAQCVGFMAHAQIEPQAQLTWHMRALHAADAVKDDRVSAFYPSLYANVAEVSLRLGMLSQARQYLNQAHAAKQILPDDSYGSMIRSLIARITEAMAQDNQP
jgi:hypothetical protein